MSGRLSITGLGPVLEVPMLPSGGPFVVPMPDGGSLKIALSTADRYLAIAFTDTGVGIRPEDFGRIFEPQHTTKPDGSGLGLMIVQRIVQEHGGQIEVASKPEQGTLRLSAQHENDHVVIRVNDDGRGLDAARLRAKAVEKVSKATETAAAAPAPAPAPAAAPAEPAQPITLHFNVDARPAEGTAKKTVVIRKEGDKLIGEVASEKPKESGDA
jgi:anti-sigma regulatory factor (Ser/Thr protein kinase)